MWRRHHCQLRIAKSRPMLGAQGFWARRDLYRATPAVTHDIGFSGLIRRTAQFSRFLRHARGCWRPTLTLILTGPHSVASYDTLLTTCMGMLRTYSCPDPQGGTMELKTKCISPSVKEREYKFSVAWNFCNLTHKWHRSKWTRLYFLWLYMFYICMYSQPALQRHSIYRQIQLTAKIWL
jgi:hypothetical protein